MKLEIVLAALFTVTIVGLGTWSWYYEKSPLAPSWPAPSASVSVKIEPPPVPSKIPAGDDPRLYQTLDRCRTGGGVPVVGYGWRVVCLKPQSAEWFDDHQPPKGDQ